MARLLEPIMDKETKIVDVEVVVEPPLPKRAAPASQAHLPPKPSPEGSPIHALSALILVSVDSLWAIFDWLPPIWPIAIPLCFLGVFLPTLVIQKNLKQDSTGRALAFAFVLGVLAAIPTPISGTPIGLGLLAWTGLGRILGKPADR